MPWIGGALAGAGSLGSGALGCLGSSNAASAETNALNKQIGFEQSILQAFSQQLAPWYNSGTAALNQLDTFLGLPGPNNAAQMGTPGWGAGLESPSQFSTNYLGIPLAGAPTPYNMPTPTINQFQASPGYQYQLSQGVNAIQNASGPTQGVLSGNTLQALQKYGTGLANQDWYNWLNNYQNQYNTQWSANNQNYWNQIQGAAAEQQNIVNRLGGISTGGQQAATLTGPQSSLISGIGNAFAGIGQANAAGILGQYGGLSNILQGLLGSGSSGTNNLSSLFQGLFNQDFSAGSNTPISGGYNPASGGVY